MGGAVSNFQNLTLENFEKFNLKAKRSIITEVLKQNADVWCQGFIREMEKPENLPNGVLRPIIDKLKFIIDSKDEAFTTKSLLSVILLGSDDLTLKNIFNGLKKNNNNQVIKSLALDISSLSKNTDLDEKIDNIYKNITKFANRRAQMKKGGGINPPISTPKKANSSKIKFTLSEEEKKEMRKKCEEYKKRNKKKV